jgi:hypothetical protein
VIRTLVLQESSEFYMRVSERLQFAGSEVFLQGNRKHNYGTYTGSGVQAVTPTDQVRSFLHSDQTETLPHGAIAPFRHESYSIIRDRNSQLLAVSLDRDRRFCGRSMLDDIADAFLDNPENIDFHFRRKEAVDRINV